MPGGDDGGFGGIDFSKLGGMGGAGGMPGMEGLGDMEGGDVSLHSRTLRRVKH